MNPQEKRRNTKNNSERKKIKKNENSLDKKTNIINEEERLNINKEKEINNKEKKIKINNKIDELAKTLTKNIMNLCFSDIKESNRNNKTNKDLSFNLNKNDKIKNEDIASKMKIENENLFHNIKFNNNKNINNNKINILNENKADERNYFDIKENKIDNDFKEIKSRESYKDNLYGNKTLDETTKNTINDILEFVLKEMKPNIKGYRRKYSQRNKRLRINEDKKIEIIEEEDKESSTSEMCKEKIIKDFRNSMSSLKDELIESNKNYSLTENKRKYNGKNNSSQLLLSINNKKNEISNKKDIINIPLNDLNNKSNLKDNENKENKFEIEGGGKENVIQININDNKSKINDNSDIFENSSSNNDNITISNNNSIIDNNSLEIENFEIEFTKVKKNKNTKKNEKKLKNTSPKDNKKQIINRIDIDSLKIEGNNNLENIINEGKINNININTIKAQNIIIINNNIINTNKKQKIKKNEMKLNISKEPKDAKIPKDNKRKNINIINKKVTKKYSNNSINNNLLNNETISNDKSRANNKNIDILKFENKKKLNHASNNDNERSSTDADHLNLTLNYKKSKNYIKLNENKNISISNIKNNNKKNIIVSNKGKELNKTNINNPNNNVNRKFIKSKTQEFKSTKKIGNNEFEDKIDDFLNLNDKCLIY